MGKQKGRIDALKCVCASSNTDFIYANFGRVSNRLYFMKGKHLLSVDFLESASEADIRKAILEAKEGKFLPSHGEDDIESTRLADVFKAL